MTEPLGTEPLGTDELRAVVRAVLRDVLPDLAPAPPESPSQPPSRSPSRSPARPRVVSVRTDADLDALVREVAAEAADPARRDELRAGRHRYRLARDDTPPRGGAVVRVERGAVTERTVRRAAADGARLVVGRRAVLTPLARDRARALGVEVEREQEMSD